MRDDLEAIEDGALLGVDYSEEERVWMQRARDAYQASTDYMDHSLRKQWERNVSHFINEFPHDSKYKDRANKGRSKVFRPKTRANIRANEAAFARALFSTTDLLDVDPWDDSNEAARASADVAKALLNYRLERTIPWFLTAMGAYQDACVYGVCCSYQYWRYEETTERVPMADAGQLVLDEEGQPSMQQQARVLRDEPCIDLLPPENIRFDPGADWRDPINTSPYVIRLVPMYADDVLARMNAPDPKTGMPQWRKYTLEQLLASRRDEYDSTRRAREGDDRGDSHEQEPSKHYTTIWLHENFVRVDGKEYVYWTAGTDLLLTPPTPLEEVYLHNRRPLTMGMVVMESHRTHPSGLAQLMDGLQESTNDLQNQRFDNVQLVLNKRYFLRRGQQVDLQALMRNVPGGGVMMTDPERDVKIVDTPDVTASSYNEQDRIDLQMDEISGNFSQGTVANSRNLNETVGGMEMMNSGATAVQELNIRTFIETWVEPVLEQLLLLEQAYETDTALMAIAAKNSGAYQRYGIGPEDVDQMIREGMTVRVSVGMGAINPSQKLNRMLTALQAVGQNVPGALERIKPQEVINEAFGIMGYRDGSRFFKTDEQVQQEMAQAGPQIPPEIQLEQAKLQNEQQEMQIRMQIAQMEQQARLQMQQNELQVRSQTEAMKLALEKELKLEDLYRKLGMEQMKEQNKRAMEAAKLQTERDIKALVETNRMNEMKLRRETGAGI